MLVEFKVYKAAGLFVTKYRGVFTFYLIARDALLVARDAKASKEAFVRLCKNKRKNCWKKFR